MNTKTLKEKDRYLYADIVKAGLRGMRNWQPGDEKKAKEIIGSRGWGELTKHASGSKIGDLFSDAAINGDLPLVCVAKASDRHNLYIPV